MVTYMSLNKRAAKELTAQEMVDKENRRAIVESILAMVIAVALIGLFVTAVVSIIKMATEGA